MDNMESIEEKQKFLREEIIEKGYDPDEFSSYLIKVKDLDLSNWIMKDLITIVQSFQQDNPLANSNSSISGVAAPLTQFMPNLEANLSTTTDKEGENIIKCIKQTESKLTHIENPNIIISK